MSEMTEARKAAVYPSEIEGIWLAQGLVYDVLAQGKSREDALRRFHLTFDLEEEMRRKENLPPIPWTPDEVARAAILKENDDER